MKQIRVKLFWKFSLAITLIVAIFGSINAYLIWRNVQLALERESEKRGIIISHHLAEELVNPLLYEDYITMYRMLETAKAEDSSIDYAFVVDKSGRVVSHTFPASVPAALLQANQWQGPATVQVKLLRPIQEPNRIIRDIATPLLEGNLGTLRIGIREESLNEDVRNTVTTFWMMALLFLAIGIAGAFVFARLLTDPIQDIERVTNEMNFDALQQRSLPRVNIRSRLFGKIKLLFRAEDEIDHLADNFNQMISRLEDTYADLRLAQQKLLQSEKMATIGTLASGLAHEINNPLAGIQNCLRRLERNPENIAQNRKYLTLMSEAVERIDRVVKSMLEFARKQDYQFKKVNLAEIVDNALILISYKLEKSQIKIKKKQPAELPAIRGSAHHLEQVFVNLIINAIDAIDEHCRTTTPCEKRITIDFEVRKESLCLHISDTGKGIDSNDMARIFDPFFTTKEVGKGTGLGLAVSLNIIEAHGGHLKVKSQPGKGSTFSLILPIETESNSGQNKYAK